jgi:hypothetical protein
MVSMVASYPIIGGLEDADDTQNPAQTLHLDGTNYVVSNKFKAMLRDSLLDWGTFLEIYRDNLDSISMFEQVTKLLNIKENEALRDMMLPIVRKIYNLSASAHVACMMRQFMVYEPVSIVVYNLFNILKHHFERIVELFILTRNEYIIKNKLSAKLNDYSALNKEWNNTTLHNTIDTSSVILFFLNPPDKWKSNIQYKVPGQEEVINKLKTAIDGFKYPGFCQKVPHERLAKLLKFPINEFIIAIRAMNQDIKFPNYSIIEDKMKQILTEQKTKPVIDDKLVRETPPKELVQTIVKLSDARAPNTAEDKILTDAKLQLVKWYVDRIMELRKKLVVYGKHYEDYYIETAKVMNKLTDEIKTALTSYE